MTRAFPSLPNRCIVTFVVPLLALGLLDGTAAAEVKSQTVTYRHGNVELVGHLAWDDSSQATRPGVLVVHEWWGLNDYARRRAEQLAALGYVALAVDMYGEGKATQHPQQAREWATAVRQNADTWYGRAMAGLEVLRKHPRVDPQRLAAIGYCFGGSTVMHMAFRGAPLRGVVSFHGALVMPPEDAKVQARLLVCHGAADGFIPEEQCQQFRAALQQAGIDYQMVYYGGARHSFTDPGADKHGIEGLKYDARADARSWSLMRQFFQEIFAP
jgi:dienelactone hydrolase